MRDDEKDTNPFKDSLRFDVSKVPATPQIKFDAGKHIKEVLDKQSNNTILTESVIKLQDKELKDKLMKQNSISPLKQIDLFLVERYNKIIKDHLVRFILNGSSW